MKFVRVVCWRKFLIVAVLTISQILSPTALRVATAKQPVDHTNPPIVLNKWAGTIDYAPGGTSTLYLSGTASHLGKFEANCEVVFVPGAEEGSLAGVGVAAFQAANGDFLVGTVTVTADTEGLGSLTFHWRDSVEFSDGIADSTGRFANADDRPPGLVVIAIIAILIGLLLPAVQK